MMLSTDEVWFTVNTVCIWRIKSYEFPQVSSSLFRDNDTKKDMMKNSPENVWIQAWTSLRTGEETDCFSLYCELHFHPNDHVPSCSIALTLNTSCHVASSVCDVGAVRPFVGSSVALAEACRADRRGRPGELGTNLCPNPKELWTFPSNSLHSNSLKPCLNTNNSNAL